MLIYEIDFKNIIPNMFPYYSLVYNYNILNVSCM